MVRLPIVLLLALSIIGLGSSAAEGAIRVVPLRADLTNAGEPGGVTPTLTTGAPRPASFGTATMQLSIDDLGTADPADDVPTQMTFFAEVHNIDFGAAATPPAPQTPDTNDNLAIAHIHGSPTVTPTTNAGVVWGFFGSPFNDTAPNDHVFTPFATGVGGTISGKWDPTEGNGGTNLAAQLNNLLTVHTYVNFHTVQFGGGEVRGMIVVVPEPAALLLLAVSVVPLVAFRRSRS
jgi:CHRD domain